MFLTAAKIGVALSRFTTLPLSLSTRSPFPIIPFYPLSHNTSFHHPVTPALTGILLSHNSASLPRNTSFSWYSSFSHSPAFKIEDLPTKVGVTNWKGRR